MEEQVLDLLKDALKKNPIDWGETLIDEDEALENISKAIFSVHKKLNPASKEVVLLAAIIQKNLEITAMRAERELLIKSIVNLTEKSLRRTR